MALKINPEKMTSEQLEAWLAGLDGTETHAVAKHLVDLREQVRTFASCDREGCVAPAMMEPWVVIVPLEGTVSAERYAFCSRDCLVLWAAAELARARYASHDR